ncbi:MAG: hypothetical protein KDD37_07245 [Bdellovibrionales bacterium]|nr:hypothetical protein [Bdellovibrionales bacterium]
MKKVHLFISTILVASFLVACSDDKSADPVVITPTATPAPITPTGDGFITWQSQDWSNSIADSERFAEMMTFGQAGNTWCGTDGYYPSSGHRYFYGNQDCGYYTRKSFIIVRYNPSTKKVRLYVYGQGNNGLYVGYFRETTASNEHLNLFADFGPLTNNGNTPDHISSYKVYIVTPTTNLNDTEMPIEVRFGPAPEGDVAAVDNLIRVK